jgi:hypothetical protein
MGISSKLAHCSFYLLVLLARFPRYATYIIKNVLTPPQQKKIGFPRQSFMILECTRTDKYSVRFKILVVVDFFHFDHWPYSKNYRKHVKR